VTVYLVGAGPGDPGLLTRRGAALLADAEVVVYDRLVDPAVLALCRPGAVLIDVGKWPGEGARPSGRSPQDEINELLLEHASAGRRVVRLKGGDPFVFGRGGEEAEALAARGISVEVVAGVSSAFAVPASAGVPVTYRGLAGAVTVVTGQGGDPEGEGRVDWEALGRVGGTLVVLMGVATRGDIAERLQRAGREPATPVAVIERGTTPERVVIRTTLAALAATPVEPPATIVIGAVAALDLGRARGPLDGWSVVVTRATSRAGPLAGALAQAGATVVALPVIETVDPDDGGAALAAAAGHVASYDWVVFTSATAVVRFCAALGDLRTLGGVRLAAVGSATEESLRTRQLPADLVPARSSAGDLAEALGVAASGGRVLFPKAAAADPDLVEGLRARGWSVDAVDAYRTLAAAAPERSTVERLRRADAVTFTSPSTVSAYLDARDADGAALTVPPVVACIGAKTAAAARGAGLSGVVEATRASVGGLVDALVAYRAGAPGSGDESPTS